MEINVPPFEWVHLPHPFSHFVIYYLPTIESMILFYTDILFNLLNLQLYSKLTNPADEVGRIQFLDSGKIAPKQPYRQYALAYCLAFLHPCTSCLFHSFSSRHIADLVATNPITNINEWHGEIWAKSHYKRPAISFRKVSTKRLAAALYHTGLFYSRVQKKKWKKKTKFERTDCEHLWNERGFAT